MSRTPPTVDQLRILVDRADRGPLQPAEVARLRAGIAAFAERQRRAARTNRVQAARVLTLRRRLRALHAPMWRGGVEVCRECSGWDGQRCRGLVTPYPCPTVDAVDSPVDDANATRQEGTERPQSAPQPANDTQGVRGATRPPQRRTRDFDEEAA